MDLINSTQYQPSYVPTPQVFNRSVSIHPLAAHQPPMTPYYPTSLPQQLDYSHLLLNQKVESSALTEALFGKVLSKLQESEEKRDREMQEQRALIVQQAEERKIEISRQ